MNLKLKATLAAVAMVFAANSANAASTASATLGPINVTLIDLNLADNIAPTITWAYYSGDGDYGDLVGAIASDSAVNNTQYGQNRGANYFSNVSTSSTTAQSSANADIISGADDSKPDGATLSVSGNAQGTTTTGHYSGFDIHSDSYYGQFTLGAYTGVLFSAAATIDIANTVGYQRGWGNEYTSANTGLSVWDTAAGGNIGSLSSNDFLSDNVSYKISSAWNSETNQNEVTYSGEQENLTGTLAVSYYNSTGQDKVGKLHVIASVHGVSHVQAVPEPNTYAMLLAGLGLIGFMARRRM